MTKIAIEFRQRKDEIVEELKKKDYEISNSSNLNIIWVNDLSSIDYLYKDLDGFKIRLNKNKIDYRNAVEIYLEDIEYFEIHS